MREPKTMPLKEGPVLRRSAVWMCIGIAGGIGAEGLEKNDKRLKKSRNKGTQQHTKHQIATKEGVVNLICIGYTLSGGDAGFFKMESWIWTCV